ncbi:MAG: methyltransferase domain-containing protein [Acutalibacteraceae bacterium]
MNDWNSNQYIKFEKERTQPSVDLISRIRISPESVLDIGCGPGNSTNQLFEHFPKVNLLGIDSSDNMIDKAKKSYPNLNFRKCIIPDDIDELEKYDLIFSNACLHWIPDHKKLLPTLMDKLNTGGILAVQMPLVQNALFYNLLDQLVATEKWKKLDMIRNFHNLSPNETYDILSQTSCCVTMWETSYYHIVTSHNDIIEWYKGSGLRPYLEKLDTTEKSDFLNDLLGIIKQHFPIQADKSIILKMPRLFFIANK